MQRRRIKKYIENKIFDKKSITRLVDFAYSEWEKEESDHKRFNITLNSEENETFEFEDQKLESSILDDKKIRSIDISFINFRGNENSININLRHGNYTYDGSDYEIKSADPSWINDIKSRLEEVFEIVTPQSVLFLKYRKLGVHLFSLTIGVVLFQILLLFSISNNDSNTTKLNLSPVIYYSLILFLIYSMGILFTFFFLGRMLTYIENLWPSIEFDFGPEHKKREKKRREAIKWFFTILVIPIILGIILKFI